MLLKAPVNCSLLVIVIEDFQKSIPIKEDSNSHKILLSFYIQD